MVSQPELQNLHEAKIKIVSSNGDNNGTNRTNDHISNLNSNSTNGDVINLDHGDPKMFYPYWKQLDNECSVTIKASDLISYLANPNEPDFFFQMPEFNDAVRRIHRVVGNAVTDGRYIIGGTGSSQLFIAALRALASTMKETTSSKHVPVVCVEPFYSAYKEAVEQERSEIYKWKGDANRFEEQSGPYIEVVTSPNNPDGVCRKPVVKREGGMVLYDLAYYWPHYTPIISPADYDVMLFTLSKATGHAGSRVGWAIVKDQEIAKKMKQQILGMSIGSCQEGQLRATKILHFIADKYKHAAHYMVEKPLKVPKLFEVEGLFEFGQRILARRWEQLRTVVQRIGVIRLPEFSPGICSFSGKLTYPTPAFAWLECQTGEDAEQFMRNLKIQARNGSRFGNNIPGRYMRLSMMGDDHNFNLFLERLSSLSIME
ncbi:L-tryptophan--pyruvate aminotransferase 1 [Beta vulgaris subsp. vulgaris]|uniref:L-tryptophan--pyruvate aminotransferase 1 n=1 Tax=Beta vulgaris subsp. vulgaris TaxID=3555 RepID=UPI00254960C7|nr:L-tryptophan--pyruvate aminotransferase 1 [Beta vulgaris subsp. vulgaris]